MERPTDRAGYLPSLDGWRALAVLAVMLAHDYPHRLLGKDLRPYQDFAGNGLFLFFALSGVLIGWRILEEERRVGRFDLKHFYIRRFFRLQPVQWIYLASIALVMLLGGITVSWTFWFGSLFFFINFLLHAQQQAWVDRQSYVVTQFWTLAVEEHFYLLISLFFAWVTRRRVLWMTTLFLLLITVQQVAARLGFYSDDVSYRRTYWVIQYLLFGTLATLLLRLPALMDIARRWWRPWVAALVTIMAVLLYNWTAWKISPLQPKPFVHAAVFPLRFCMTGWVTASMLHPRSWTTRVLELAPLRFMGRISYSLYLWHRLFFAGGNPAWCHWHWITWTNGTPQRYILSFTTAIASYYLLERPMIRLGHRFAPPATPGHSDLGGQPASLAALVA